MWLKRMGVAAFLAVALSCAQSRASAQQKADFVNAIRLYFSEHGRYLAWPEARLEPEIGQVLRESNGWPELVMKSCVPESIVSTGKGPFLPRQYRVFHRGRRPHITIDFSGLGKSVSQRPTPIREDFEQEKSGKETLGELLKEKLPGSQEQIPPGPPPQSKISQIVEAFLGSLKIELPGEDSLDIYVQVGMGEGAEIQEISEHKLVKRFEARTPDQKCLQRLRDKGNFIVGRLWKGRLRLSVAVVRANGIRQVIQVSLPPGWRRNQDQLIEMREPRVLAYYPHKVQFKGGKVKRLKPISNKKWKKMFRASMSRF